MCPPCLTTLESPVSISRHHSQYKNIKWLWYLAGCTAFWPDWKNNYFNFVYFSVQEFLAAYHITQLPLHKELQVLRAKFWSDLHSNMFAIYTTLTKGQRLAFKQFLSGGNNAIAISERLDQLKCLRLFRCFHEAGDKAICTSIQMGLVFHHKFINLFNTSLSLYDVECITLFLMCSPHKEWKS